MNKTRNIEDYISKMAPKDELREYSTDRSIYKHWEETKQRKYGQYHGHGEYHGEVRLHRMYHGTDS